MNARQPLSYKRLNKYDDELCHVDIKLKWIDDDSEVVCTSKFFFQIFYLFSFFTSFLQVFCMHEKVASRIKKLTVYNKCQ